MNLPPHISPTPWRMNIGFQRPYAAITDAEGTVVAMVGLNDFGERREKRIAANATLMMQAPSLYARAVDLDEDLQALLREVFAIRDRLPEQVNARLACVGYKTGLLIGECIKARGGVV